MVIHRIALCWCWAGSCAQLELLGWKGSRSPISPSLLSVSFSPCFIPFPANTYSFTPCLWHSPLRSTFQGGEKGKMFPLCSSSNCANTTRSIVKKMKCCAWRKRQRSWSAKAMLAYWSRKNLYPTCSLPHIQRQSWRLVLIPVVIWQWLAIFARG